MFLRATDVPDRPPSPQHADGFGRFHVEAVGLDPARLHAAVEKHRLGRMPSADHVRAHA